MIIMSKNRNTLNLFSIAMLIAVLSVNSAKTMVPDYLRDLGREQHGQEAKQRETTGNLNRLKRGLVLLKTKLLVLASKLMDLGYSLVAPPEDEPIRELAREGFDGQRLGRLTMLTLEERANEERQSLPGRLLDDFTENIQEPIDDLFYIIKWIEKIPPKVNPEIHVERISIVFQSAQSLHHLQRALEFIDNTINENFEFVQRLHENPSEIKEAIVNLFAQAMTKATGRFISLLEDERITDETTKKKIDGLFFTLESDNFFEIFNPNLKSTKNFNKALRKNNQMIEQAQQFLVFFKNDPQREIGKHFNRLKKLLPKLATRRLKSSKQYDTLTGDIMNMLEEAERLVGEPLRVKVYQADDVEEASMRRDKFSIADDRDREQAAHYYTIQSFDTVLTRYIGSLSGFAGPLGGKGQEYSEQKALFNNLTTFEQRQEFIENLMIQGEIEAAIALKIQLEVIKEQLNSITKNSENLDQHTDFVRELFEELGLEEPLESLNGLFESFQYDNLLGYYYQIDRIIDEALDDPDIQGIVLLPFEQAEMAQQLQPLAFNFVQACNLVAHENSQEVFEMVQALSAFINNDDYAVFIDEEIFDSYIDYYFKPVFKAVLKALIDFPDLEGTFDEVSDHMGSMRINIDAARDFFDIAYGSQEIQNLLLDENVQHIEVEQLFDAVPIDKLENIFIKIEDLGIEDEYINSLLKALREKTLLKVGEMILAINDDNESEAPKIERVWTDTPAGENFKELIDTFNKISDKRGLDTTIEIITDVPENISRLVGIINPLNELLLDVFRQQYRDILQELGLEPLTFPSDYREKLTDITEQLNENVEALRDQIEREIEQLHNYFLLYSDPENPQQREYAILNIQKIYRTIKQYIQLIVVFITTDKEIYDLIEIEYINPKNSFINPNDLIYLNSCGHIWQIQDLWENYKRQEILEFTIEPLTRLAAIHYVQLNYANYAKCPFDNQEFDDESIEFLNDRLEDNWKDEARQTLIRELTQKLNHIENNILEELRENENENVQTRNANLRRELNNVRDQRLNNVRYQRLLNLLNNIHRTLSRINNPGTREELLQDYANVISQNIRLRLIQANNLQINQHHVNEFILGDRNEDLATMLFEAIKKELRLRNIIRIVAQNRHVQPGEAKTIIGETLGTMRDFGLTSTELAPSIGLTADDINFVQQNIGLFNNLAL